MPPKSAKSRHYSLLRQNSVKFGLNFTQDRKHFTQALLARLYVFPSLCCVGYYVVKRYCILLQNLTSHRPYLTLSVPENQFFCIPIKIRTLLQILCSRASRTWTIKCFTRYEWGTKLQVLSIDLSQGRKAKKNGCYEKKLFSYNLFVTVPNFYVSPTQSSV